MLTRNLHETSVCTRNLLRPCAVVSHRFNTTVLRTYPLRNDMREVLRMPLLTDRIVFNVLAECTRAWRLGLVPYLSQHGVDLSG